MMNENNGIRELSIDEMENVTGGTEIDTGMDGNAGVWKRFEDIATKRADYSLKNGTDVTILGASRFNEVKKRHYVEIQFKSKGKFKKGWVAASIVGLKR